MLSLVWHDSVGSGQHPDPTESHAGADSVSAAKAKGIGYGACGFESQKDCFFLLLSETILLLQN